MAGRQYSMLYWQDGDLDHVGEIVMDEAEAFGNLAACLIFWFDVGLVVWGLAR